MSKYSNHSLIRLCTVFIIVFFMLSVVQIQAQDTPTDIPTDVPTTVPTDVPTDVPTEVPTEVPTAAPTDVPTDVPTEQATEATAAPTTETPVAATEEASPVASETPAPTLAPEPSMTVLVSESFDNGDTSPWDSPAGWSLVTSESGLAWQVVNSNIPLNLLKGGFLNVAVQARFLLKGGSAQLIVRQSAAGNYSALIDANGLVVLYRTGVPLKVAQIAPVTAGAWRTLRLSAVDGVLRVAVDGLEVIALADAEQLPPGSVAMAANFAIPTDGSAAPQNILLADDFSLLVKTDEVVLYPSPTVIPTEQVTAAPTTETPAAATEEASPAPAETAVPTIAAEPALTLLLNDPFDSGDTANWATVAGWSLVPSENGLAWQVTNTNDPLGLLKGSFLNTAVQARFLLQGGSAQLVVRQSAIGSYTAAVDTSGIVGLYRAGVLLQQTMVAPAASDAWRTLRLSAVDGVLRVAVDGVEVIALADAEQLPPGSVAIAGNFLIPSDGSAAPQNTFLADDFSLWVTADEVPNTAAVVTETPAAPTAAVEAPTAEPTFIGKRTGPVAPPSAALIASLGPLSNDNFSGREVIPSANPLVAYTATENTAGAGTEGGEPLQPSCTGNHAIGRSVWFDFTPSVTASYTLSTAGSLFDTVMIIYTGAGVNSLTAVASGCNDDASVSTFTSLKTITLTSATTYHIQLSGFEGDYGVYTFKISQVGVPAPAAAPVLASPADNFATNNGTKPLPALTWNAVALNTHHYEIQIDDAATFALPLRQTNANILAPTTTYTVSPDLTGTAGTTYYWRVRALNSNSVPGPWSLVRKFIVDTVAPAAPALSAPTLNAIVGTTKPAFTWVAAPGANGYFVDVDNTDCTFPSPEISNAPVAAATFTPATPLPQGTYCWRVTSKDAAGNTGTPGTGRSFSIFIGILPANNQLYTPVLPAVTMNVTFTWGAVPTATNYSLDILDGTCTTPISGTYPLLTGLVLTKAVTGLPYGNYCWNVQAVGVDPGTPPTFRKFTISPAAPLPPVLTALSTPTINQLTNDNTPTFTWPASTSTLGTNYTYDLQADNNGCLFPTPELNQTGILALTYTPLVALNDGVNCWRVRTVNTFGVAGAWSVVPRNFTVDTTAPVAPTLSAPAINAIVGTTRPTFTWTAVAGTQFYLVDVDNDGCGFPSPEILNANPTTVSLTPVVPLPQGNYCWRVQSKDAAGNIGNESLTRNFSIFIGTAPANNLLITTATTTNVTFTWTAVPGATDYNLNLMDSTCVTPIGGYPLPTTLVLTKAVIGLAAGKYCWNIQSVGAGLDAGVPPVFRRFTVSPAAPVAPILSAPTAAQLTNDNTPTFTWAASISTTATPYLYDLQADNSGCTFPSPEVNQLGLNALTFTQVGALLDGVYCWRVRTVNTFSVAGPWSVTPRNFTIDTSAPAAPNLLLPAPNAIVGTTKPAFTWTAAPGANGYFVDVDATNCTFNNKVITAAPVAAATFTPATPLPQGTYCWRVTSKDAAGNTGTPGTGRSFSIFIGIAPADKALITTATTGNVTFTWGAVPTATNYQLDLMDSTCVTPIGGYPLTTGLVLTKAVTGLAAGNYCWNIQAVGVDLAVPTTFRRFTVSPAAPVAPILSAPTAGQSTNDNTPTFTWAASTSITAQPYLYDLQADNSGCTFPSPEVNQPGLNALTFTQVTPLVNGVYCWRVRTVNTFSVAGPWSVTPRNFTVDIQPPAAPVLGAPANNATLTNNRPTFTWGVVAGATKYNFKYGTSNPPTNTVQINAVAAPSFIPPGPLLNKTYYWQVEAVDAAGNTTASVVRSVKITSLLNAAPILNRFTGSPISLTWSPVSWVSGGGHYELVVDNNSTFVSPEFTKLDVLEDPAPSWDVSPLPAGTWYWRVRACSGALASTCSPTWSSTGTFQVDN